MAKKKKKSAGGGGRSTATTTTTTAAANEAGAKGLIWVDPSRCRFQHSRIRPHFSGCGRSVHETLEDIKAGTTRISDLPPIQVIVGGGGGENEYDDDDDNNNNEGVSNAEPWYFSLNNRRLWVLKRLREEGFLEPHGNKVAVRVRQPKSQKERERYTLANCSLDAKIMGEKKQPQLPQQQQQQQQQQPPRIRIRTEEQEPEAEKPEQQQAAAESTTSSLPAAMGDGDKGDDSGYDSESSGNEGDEASIEKQVSVTISNRFGGMMMDDSSSSGSDDGSDGV